MTSITTSSGASSHGDALRQEIAEEVQPVFLERHHRHQDEHQQRQRQRHHDVAGEGEEQREDAQQVAEQDEEEQGEHEWERICGLPGRSCSTHIDMMVS